MREWHRGFQARPPALATDDPRHPRFDPRYAVLKPDQVPNAESLADTVARVVPFWQEVVVPELQEGKDALVVARGGSLRALIRHVCEFCDDDLKERSIPTGKLLVLELDGDMTVTRPRYL